MNLISELDIVNLKVIVQCAQAPQFVDFNNLGGGAAPEEEDRADEFFNVDMESGER